MAAFMQARPALVYLASRENHVAHKGEGDLGAMFEYGVLRGSREKFQYITYMIHKVLERGPFRLREKVNSI